MNCAFQQAFERTMNQLAGHVPVKPHVLRNGTGVISFTFDDVPQSALAIGGAVLARHGCAGTFYVAGGLTGGVENGMTCHNIDDLNAAQRDGHELASHGFAHTPYLRLAPREVTDDIERNARFFEDEIHIEPSRHFSYPLGMRSVPVKAQLADYFVTARGIRPGVNERVCDLVDLRANALYARTASERMVHHLIRHVAENSGWLIFYTHYISTDPSPFGVTPALFDFGVCEALASGCRILPVRNAVGAISYR